MQTMTIDEFRTLALSLPEATEATHMAHPDFRVRNKIFATLGYPERGWGMVKVTLNQQKRLVHEDPEAYVPVKGAWGQRGATTILLRSAKRGTVLKALTAAWCNTAPKTLVRSHLDRLALPPP
jgi:hypothetical protein